ncbi:MAG: hypothetical protein AAB727_01850 [Patescibacteria group bacterium]
MVDRTKKDFYMPISDDARLGQERKNIADGALARALEEWKKAPADERSMRATTVLAHIGSMGLKLKDVVTDLDEAQRIRNDAQKK